MKKNPPQMKIIENYKGKGRVRREMRDDRKKLR